MSIPILGFPGGSDGKESSCNAGDLGLIPVLGRSPGEGNGNAYQSVNNNISVFIVRLMWHFYQKDKRESIVHSWQSTNTIGNKKNI